MRAHSSQNNAYIFTKHILLCRVWSKIVRASERNLKIDSDYQCYLLREKSSYMLS